MSSKKSLLSKDGVEYETVHIRNPSESLLDIFRCRIISNIPYQITKTIKVIEKKGKAMMLPFK